jgi:hypothetical protein
MQTFAVSLYEKFFTAMVLRIEKKVVMVQHWKEEVVKFPGGTYNPQKEGALIQEDYDVFDTKALLAKIECTLLNAFSIHSPPSEEISKIAHSIFEKFKYHPPAFHGIIEYIEETGIIPLEIDPYFTQIVGIQQFFYTINTALTYSKKSKSFKRIEFLKDLPTRKDFIIQDSEIQKTRLISLEKELWALLNIAHSHEVILKKIKNEATILG